MIYDGTVQYKLSRISLRLRMTAISSSPTGSYRYRIDILAQNAHIVAEFGEDALVLGGDQRARRVAHVARARHRRAVHRSQQMLLDHACFSTCIACTNSLVA